MQTILMDYEKNNDEVFSRLLAIFFFLNWKIYEINEKTNDFE